MSQSQYDIIEVAAKRASPKVINTIITELLKANDGACYSEMERYLMPPGVAGSRSFDQALAVEILLKHDATGDGSISKIMVAKPTVTRRNLWDRLQTVLRQVGFQLKHGRLVGLLEVDAASEDNGQPDIE